MNRRSLDLADEAQAATVAFPAISTGVYGYPIGLATEIAIDTVRSASTDVREVTFVCFGPEARRVYEAALA